MYTFALF